MSGKFWKRFHLIILGIVFVLWAAATFLGWLSSVAFVSHISMLALVLAELSAYQSARVERNQDKE
jgi:integral membrane sensor domain MASE1